MEEESPGPLGGENLGMWILAEGHWGLFPGLMVLSTSSAMGIPVVSLEHPDSHHTVCLPSSWPEAQAYCRGWVQLLEGPGISVQEDPTPSKCLVTSGPR